ncbi:amine sulfotransferase-like [Pelodytes ibericus]
MDTITPVLRDENLYRYKEFNFIRDLHKIEYIDTLLDFEIKDDDVFLVTYPKSGTVWTQNILSMIYSEGHRNGTENISTDERAPWIEFNIKNLDIAGRPSPRLFTTHLAHHLVPKELRNKKGKVIYVTRNPKDVIASFYHFSLILVHTQKPPNFETYLETFLAGDVFGGRWFDHVRGWYTHKDDFNILYIKYEDMIMDLRSVVKQICTFVGRELDEEALDIVVEKASFQGMKKDSRANKEDLPEELFIKSKKGVFMRKGTIGDWKNLMTVAQSESFDEIFKENMKDLPIHFTWDLPDNLK